MVAIVAAAVTAMYRERQKTRRTEIRHHPENVTADAWAGLVGATYKAGPEGTPQQNATEAKLTRESARLVFTEHGKAVLAELTRMKANHASEAEDEDTKE